MKTPSQSAIARALGLTRASISKLAKAGMPVSSVAAAREWRKANVNAYMRLSDAEDQSAPAKPPRRAGKPASKGTKEIPEAPAALDVPEEMTYTQARARRERAEARRAEIELMKLEGTLCDREGVERAAFAFGRAVRDRLMNLPVRIAPILAPVTNAFELERQLCDAIRGALNECLDTMPGLPPPVA